MATKQTVKIKVCDNEKLMGTLCISADNPFDSSLPEPVEPEPIVDIPDDSGGGSSALKTVGVMAAVGAGVGAAAYAAHRVIDKNNMDDNYYQYEKSSKKDDEKQDSLDDQYKEYYSDKNMNAFGGEQ